MGCHVPWLANDICNIVGRVRNSYDPLNQQVNINNLKPSKNGISETIKNFLINSEETGRHIVTSFRTGKKYYVEPIGNGRSDWGDIDPATKQVTGNYGDRYTGSVTEKESIVTLENGFKNVVLAGNSPYWVIEELDKKYPTINKI